MNESKISESIAKEVKVFEQDLQETKGQNLDIQKPEHKRVVANIVANEKAYRSRLGS